MLYHIILNVAWDNNQNFFFKNLQSKQNFSALLKRSNSTDIALVVLQVKLSSKKESCQVVATKLQFGGLRDTAYMQLDSIKVD